MDRGGWLVWALSATLIATSVGANAALLVDDMASTFEEQSKAFPADRPWYFRGAGIVLAAAAVLLALSTAVVAYGWGKVGAKGRQATAEPKPLFEEDDERDPLEMPPGFFAGPKLRTKRDGLAPLVGFNLLGAVLLGVGGLLVYVGVTQFVQSVATGGDGFRAAILWGRLIRFAGLPLMGVAGVCLGLAWGRWFPLGRRQVVRAGSAPDGPRPTRATWDRQA